MTGLTQGHMVKGQRSWGLRMGYLVPGPHCHPLGLLWLVEWETLPLRTGSAREGDRGYLLFRGLLVN